MQEGGDHEDTYALNSQFQNRTFHSFVKTHLAQLIQHHFQHLPGPPICVADFGCSRGRNPLHYANFIVEILRRRHSSAEALPAPKIHYFFSDFPSNDFNSLFRLLASEKLIDKEYDDEERSYFAAAVPGSLYGRLFPERSLHLGVSTYSLHWLSQIPPSVVDRESPSWNGGHSWISGDRPLVAEAFAKQFETDLTRFLKCRTKELVIGGLLYVLLLGRPDRNGARECYGFNPWSNEFEGAWADMVCEGLVDANLRDTFNIPLYTPCVSEFEDVVKTVPEFRLLEVKLVEVPNLPKQELELGIAKSDAKLVMAKLAGDIIQSVMNPVVEAQIGVELSKSFFHRLKRQVEEGAWCHEREGEVGRHELLCALLTRK